ncbi:uncharacterized protein TRUGW13939_02049 [Talaromyces rugulosus]|uniref:Major facilitator superfamily (MFS) profile domain-containing protein n=1 Tax=Talaromyces rugulosus TaxID=121627 RepID=A0A7H8QM00_TALRU|nr:uncharacterized protein TRUGW13939_02049 [Talaromyces rugulosus]QKX54959.1 hypothetical protein TRUGW13939_02049 [Talaromyces rugulosus]
MRGVVAGIPIEIPLANSELNFLILSYIAMDDKLDFAQEENITPSKNPVQKIEPVHRDPHGFPVIPQPTIHKDDPLNWHPALKLSVCLQISWLALLGPLSAAVANPAFRLMSNAFGLTVKEVSYELTVFLVCAGVGPLVVAPFANAYGRRPVYLLGNLLAAITNIIAGYCDTWEGVMITRAFNGLGAGAVISMGAATICDLYFVHQRGANFFTELYGFTTAQTGLMLSIPLLIGGGAGELSAGWVTDWLSNRHAQRHNGERLPEARLTAIWAALLVPIGVIIEGVCLSHTDTISWIGSAFGMGIANFGLQIATTTIYAYLTDCYKPQSAEISTILNLFRQIFSCLISFYAIPFADRIGVQFAWLTFAMIIAVLFIPIIMLRSSGSKWRELHSQSSPNTET